MGSGTIQYIKIRLNNGFLAHNKKAFNALRGWREVIPFRQDTAFNDFPTMLVALKRQLSFQSRREIPAGGKGNISFFFFFFFPLPSCSLQTQKKIQAHDRMNMEHVGCIAVCVFTRAASASRTVLGWRKK